MNSLLNLTEKTLKLIGLRSLGNFVELIRVNGGFVKSVVKFARYDDIKKGEFVGEDEFGNRYFQSDYYFFGRNRWVEYADHVGFNYDSSQITPQWYGWLHYKTDYLPTEDPTRPNYPWLLKPTENLTLSNDAYKGYSTGKPKITLWQPKSKARN